MKIVIKTKNVELTQALKKYIQEKFNSLEKFLQIFQEEKYFNHFFGKGKPRVELWVEIGKETLHHQKGPFFWAECQMRFPGKSLRATARLKDLKLAIVEVKDELQRQLKKYKEKITTKDKRKQRVFKKTLKISPSARFYRKGRIREEGV
ncbi:ribosome-associated translation inhibitor RaiA [Patescibacteria group bacterium]|nr:ribosome-associated translation inhibitor RaiA [Patescibacteria group bacterium]